MRRAALDALRIDAVGGAGLLDDVLGILIDDAGAFDAGREDGILGAHAEELAVGRERLDAEEAGCGDDVLALFAALERVDLDAEDLWLIDVVERVAAGRAHGSGDGAEGVEADDVLL